MSKQTVAKSQTRKKPKQLQDLVEIAFGERTYQLRRDGLAPLSINGRLLGEVTSHVPGTRLWYELSAYGVSEGYVAAIRIYKKDITQKDMFRAAAFNTFPELCSYFEHYQPSHDVTAAEDLTDARLSTAEAMIRATGLRQRIDEAQSEYRSAAGELLTELAYIDSALTWTN